MRCCREGRAKGHGLNHSDWGGGGGTGSIRVSEVGGATGRQCDLLLGGVPRTQFRPLTEQFRYQLVSHFLTAMVKGQLGTW